MKRRWVIFTAALWAVTACTTPTDEGIDNPSSRTVLTVDIAAPTSRIALGEREDDSYPLLWQSDDCISINGTISSEAVIDEDNPRSAQFIVNSTLEKPYHILYPASTDATVEFVAEQSYTKGSFDAEAMPMYGYAESEERVTMQHLCGVLRFSLTGSATLRSMTISAEQGALAGRYTIDCSTGTLGEGTNTTSTISYSFGEGLALSDEAQHLFVTLPAGEYGVCSAVLHDTAGGYMQLLFSTEGDMTLRAGVVREFQTVAYSSKSEVLLEPLSSVGDGELVAMGEAVGYVRYDDGSPAVGVAVSDGFQVVTTDADGRYSFKPSKDTWYIFISLPSDCRIMTNEQGMPDFYHRYNHNYPQRYDFRLSRLKGGAEQEFMFYAFGDPQVASENAFARFTNESIPVIAAHAAKQTLPCYGMGLGDIISSGTLTDRSSFMPRMRSQMTSSVMGMPIFQTMGNHDHKGCNRVRTDSRNSSLRLAAQRTYEECFGPVNYSFNRGKVHIVSMMDIHYDCTSYDTYFDFADYSTNFADEQVEWLRQDLAVVPKDMMVILCVHSQLNLYVTKRTNVNRVMTLLDDFADAHILAGHSHDVRNRKIANYNIVEHVCGALCGAWWRSIVSRDGSPNGFATFHIDGSTIRNHVYHGINDGFNAPDYQMRLYRGSMLTGGKYEYFASSHSSSTLIANVWNGGYGWQVDAYVGDQHIGSMTHITYSLGDPWRYDSSGKELTTDELNSLQPTIQAQTSLDNPTRFSASSSVDWWSIGYLIGVGGWSKRSQALSAADNLYYIESPLLADDKAWENIRVIAKDPYGNTYTCSEVIQGTVGTDFNYDAIVSPQW